jgi:hypothetical protein
MTNATMILAEGDLIKSINTENDRLKVNPIQIATAQIASEKDSLIKPRNNPITAEISMIPIIL